MLTGSFTAHPKICPVTGEMLAFGYSSFAPYLRYLRVAADGTLVQTEEITVGGPTMMHDFNVTRNFVIFMDLPAVFNLELAMAGDMPIRWDDNYPSRLGVMPRNGTDQDVTWYDINPCYVFHPMNSYEEGDNIVLDVARFKHMWRESSMDFPRHSSGDGPSTRPPARFTRNRSTTVRPSFPGGRQCRGLEASLRLHDGYVRRIRRRRSG